MSANANANASRTPSATDNLSLVPTRFTPAAASASRPPSPTDGVRGAPCTDCEPLSPLSPLPVPRPTAQLLPMDVLSSILLAWYDAELSHSKHTARRVPFFALAVCGSWRQAAQCTPRLWREACFSFQLMLNQPRWLAIQECYARFAGAASLNSATIYCDSAAVPHGDAVWELFSSALLPRVWNIDVIIDGQACYSDVLVGRTLPALTMLRVYAPERLHAGEYPSFKLHMRAPQLAQVYLGRAVIALVDAEDEEHNPLRGIETMEVECGPYTLGQLRDLASMTPRLVDFALTVYSLWTEADESLMWPRLEVLTAYVNNVIPDAPPHRIQLPALRLLDLSDVKYNWGFWRKFVEASCPALEELCVVRNHVDHAQEFVDNMGGLRQIRSLILHDGSLNESIVELLSMPRSCGEIAFPNLRRLTFDAAVAEDGFRFASLENLLQARYAHLERSQIGGAFDLQCTLQRRINDDAHNALQAQMEVVISGWNVAARQQYCGY